MSRDYSAENEQFYDEIRTYGWLRLLKELTPLDGAIDYYGSRKSKRFDICPDQACSDHKLWGTGGQKGNFVLGSYVAETGHGYCYKCKQKFSGFDILMDFNGWDFKTAAKEVRQQIGFNPDPNYKPSPRKILRAKKAAQHQPSKTEIRQAERRREQMNTIWSEAMFLNDEWALPAAKYFAKRGITELYGLMKQHVKFHPAMPYYIPLPTSNDDRTVEDEQERLDLIDYCQTHPSFDSFTVKNGEPTMANMGKHPCLLLLIRTPYGEPRRIHRIFIDEDGNKASFEKAGFVVKKMMPGGYGLDITGCSCFLDGPAPIRGIGEGLETVLAAKQATKMPMDCTITAGGLKDYVPPEGTRLIFIFEDKDRSKTGENVAKEAEARLTKEGYIVQRLSVPLELGNRKTVDWLDVLNQLGKTGFPEEALRWQELLAEVEQ